MKQEIDNIVEQMKEEEIELHAVADIIREQIENEPEKIEQGKDNELVQINNRLNSIQGYRIKLENILMKAEEDY